MLLKIINRLHVPVDKEEQITIMTASEMMSPLKMSRKQQQIGKKQGTVDTHTYNNIHVTGQFHKYMAKLVQKSHNAVMPNYILYA